MWIKELIKRPDINVLVLLTFLRNSAVIRTVMTQLITLDEDKLRVLVYFLSFFSNRYISISPSSCFAVIKAKVFPKPFYSLGS